VTVRGVVGAQVALSAAARRAPHTSAPVATPESVLSTRVGSVRLGSPVMTASGTAGHGAELAAYGPLDALGAVVVKSLAAFSWPGNAGVRVRATPDGSMLNRVGLQGPGVVAWLEDDLPALRSSGATVVASIWGRTPEEYEEAAGALAGASGVIAVEVNVSCPNLEGHVVAHSAAATGEAVAASAAAGLPRWAKLSPDVTDIREIAAAALGAGAEALTLVNTLPATAVDVRRASVFRGGLSGPALGPVAARAVEDCRRAFPGAGIVGVGGVASGTDALALLMAGANAVQVGTAIFAEPRAPWRVQEELGRWCRRGRVRIEEIVGAALR
jgi:dihydroorotate dehydrogenase (NAD+) catalytic subunit